MNAVQRIRDLSAAHLLPESPLAQALEEVAAGLEAQERGLEAVSERLDDLESRLEEFITP